jgi:hypothetical protein
MNVYLDIDGVLLVNDNNLANYAHEFLVYITSRYPTYWLTTHCRGDIINTHAFLERTFPPKTLEIVKQILPTNWRTNKTEAINFSKPFLWFDDDIFEGERKELIKQNVLDNWIEVDFRKDINYLQRFLVSFPIPINLVRERK